MRRRTGRVDRDGLLLGRFGGQLLCHRCKDPRSRLHSDLWRLAAYPRRFHRLWKVQQGHTPVARQTTANHCGLRTLCRPTPADHQSWACDGPSGRMASAALSACLQASEDCSSSPFSGPESCTGGSLREADTRTSCGITGAAGAWFRVKAEIHVQAEVTRRAKGPHPLAERPEPVRERESWLPEV